MATCNLYWLHNNVHRFTHFTYFEFLATYVVSRLKAFCSYFTYKCYYFSILQTKHRQTWERKNSLASLGKFQYFGTLNFTRWYFKALPRIEFVLNVVYNSINDTVFFPTFKTEEVKVIIVTFHVSVVTNNIRWIKVEIWGKFYVY